MASVNDILGGNQGGSSIFCLRGDMVEYRCSSWGGQHDSEEILQQQFRARVDQQKHTPSQPSAYFLFQNSGKMMRHIEFLSSMG